MTTEKQVAANIRNAARSTGPRTLLGKIHSAGNALRHGLSAKPTNGRNRSRAVDRIYRAIKAEFPKPALAPLVRDFADAEFDILWVRAARTFLLNSVANNTKTYIPKDWFKQILRICKYPNEYVSAKDCARMDSWVYPQIPPDLQRVGYVFKSAGTRLASLDRYEDRALGRRGRILRSLYKLGSEGRSEK
jgi:hypothetical protein